MKDIGNKQFKTNAMGVPVDGIRDVYAGALADVIEAKRTPLEAREIIPRITNLDGVDISTRHITYTRYTFDGKAIITDLKPKTVPTVIGDAKPETFPLKWISVGVETDVNELDDIRTGKVYPLNRTEKAFRIVAETENNFLLNGFNALGIEGINNQTAGINTVAAGAQWSTATGSQIVEDIRKMKEAMETGKKFVARTLNLPQKLDFILDKPYTDKDGKEISDAKSIREVLEGKKYFERIKSVIGIDTPIGLDDIPNNMGFVAVQDITIGEEYMEGRSRITPIEEKISPFVVLEPEAIVKLTGATA